MEAKTAEEILKSKAMNPSVFGSKYGSVIEITIDKASEAMHEYASQFYTHQQVIDEIKSNREFVLNIISLLPENANFNKVKEALLNCEINLKDR